MAFIDEFDLEPFAEIDTAKAVAMIDDAVAQAILVAPCLATPADLSAPLQAAVKAVLRRAILRWNEAGNGGVTTRQQTAGPFSGSESVSTHTSRGLFWPVEIEQLQAICAQVEGGAGGAFSVDTAPFRTAIHADVCALTFGAVYCSCGADLAGFPLWETT